jgi:hypothetical protein
MAVGAGARAGPHHGLRVCHPADTTVAPDRQKSSRSLACEGEENSGKRPEPFGKPRRLSGAAQPAHRQSSGRRRQRGVSADSCGIPADPESQVACTRFRPAQ